MQDLVSSILLVIHLLISVGLVGAVLLQKNEGGLGGLGGGAGMSSFMTGRASANFLTKTTRWLVAAFFATSMILAWLATHPSQTSLLLPASDESGATTGGETTTAPTGDAATSATGTGEETSGGADGAATTP